MNVTNQSGDMGKRNRMRSRKDMRAKKGKEPRPRRHAGASLLDRSAERRTEERKREKEASRKRVVVVVVVARVVLTRAMRYGLWIWDVCPFFSREKVLEK